MKAGSLIRNAILAGSVLTSAVPAKAGLYESGSTGADGAFQPTASQTIELPPDGVFNYTSVNIPAGVTITYKKNAANTPVTILATSDVTIAGTLSVSATQPAGISTPGIGGPGGFDGGRGGFPGGAPSGWVNGYSSTNVGRAGMGPGGGAPGTVRLTGGIYGVPQVVVGGGGAYGVAPPPAGSNCPTTPGAVYGNNSLLPLVGGSGGGGGSGGPNLPGSGGGGGGGAIVIAASGTIDVTGSLLARGGDALNPGTTANGAGAYGGGGSGGAIRLIASTVSGNGTISAAGGSSGERQAYNSTLGYQECSNYANNSQYGGAGRIRIETLNLLRTTATTPSYTGGSPNLVFVPGLPSLRIDSVGGIPVPAVPTGSSDVALPREFSNPVTITFVTRGVTVGSTIQLIVAPSQGGTKRVDSTPTTGTTEQASASVSVDLQPGSNTLQASVTYTVVAAEGDALSIYAQGERVEKVTLSSALGSQEGQVLLTTVSGKEFRVTQAPMPKSPG